MFKFLLISLAQKSSSKFDGCYFRKRGKTVLKISQTIKHPDRRNSSRNDNMAIKRQLFPQVSSPLVDSGGLGCRVSICKSLLCHDRFLELKNYFKTWKILFLLPAPHASCQPRCCREGCERVYRDAKSRGILSSIFSSSIYLLSDLEVT